MTTPHTTPDGLLTYPQEGVGLVVSAAEHVFMLARWEARLAAVTERAERAERAEKSMEERKHG